MMKVGLAGAAADIGDFRAPFQLGYDAIQSGQPVLDNIRGIARSQHRTDRAEQAPGVITPIDPAAGLEGRFDQRLRLIQSRDSVKSAAQEEWTFLVREYHRLFWRQLKSSAGRVVSQIARGRVLREPFAGIAFGDVCLVGELYAGHRAGPVHCLVEIKAYADPHQRHAYRAPRSTSIFPRNC